jgi:hypothetical protein
MTNRLADNRYRKETIRMAASMTRQALALMMSFGILVGHPAYAADDGAGSKSQSSAAPSAGTNTAVKIEITVGDRTVTATLSDNATAKDFVSLLPITLTLHDLFGREKAGGLPRPISEQGKRTSSYEVGDLGYWSPNSDIAIYYHQDGQTIPSPGIIIFGKFDSGVETLQVPGSVKVTIRRLETSR